MEIIAFIVKKTLSALLMPVGLCVLLLLAGLFFLLRTRRSRLGVWLVSLAALWLLITSLPITSYLLVRPLEETAGPCVDPETLKRLGVRHILVLGGEGPGYPRVTEGIRLLRHLPDASLILIGDRQRSGSTARSFAVEMGAPRAALMTTTGFFDTEDEAGMFGNMVGKAPFALVTSAYHIPRAMKLFQDQGLNPVAAPCEHRTKELPRLSTCLLPNADSLLTSQLAMHEYLGLAWHGCSDALALTLALSRKEM